MLRTRPGNPVAAVAKTCDGRALIAFAIAALAARHLGVRASRLLLVPCFFILIVVLFNSANEGIGLELMGRWNNSGEQGFSGHEKDLKFQAATWTGAA